MKGLILNGANNFFTALTDNGSQVRCSLKGKKLKDLHGFYNPLAPGDIVEIEQDPLNPGQGQITALVPRKNGFVRRNQKSNQPQLLAANVDAVICVTCPERPPFRPRFTDRVLIQAAIEHIPAVIVLNKCDLAVTETVQNRIDDWLRLGYPVYTVSAKTGEGLDRLTAFLDGKVSVLTGQSGVGKSSLLNALNPALNLKTARVSSKYDRGIHTTTQGTFLSFSWATPDGAVRQIKLIDTPGVRNFSLWGIQPDELIYFFPEMEYAAVQCSFGLSCSHTTETGCRIQKDLEAGTIHPDRYESWRLIKAELEMLAEEDYS